ncbi:hypothetical protein LTR27_011330 [Elasticomyces elasticus]|nr:hypothetical protein LTR27_011330 [Elasticomyces elasticus]
MDIFVPRLQDSVTNKQLKDLLEVPFKSCGIVGYHIEKWKNHQGHLQAKITVLHAENGTRFLAAHGTSDIYPYHIQRPLKLNGEIVRFRKDRGNVDAFALRALEYQVTQDSSARALSAAAAKKTQRNVKTARFGVSRLECGVWDYDAAGRLAFTSHYKYGNTDQEPGLIALGHREAIVLLGSPTSDLLRLDLHYGTSLHIVLGNRYDPTISIALGTQAPKMYKVDGDDVLSAAMMALIIDQKASKSKEIKKTRLTALDNRHAEIAGVCFVYRLTLSDPNDLTTIRSLLIKNPRCPSVHDIPTSLQFPRQRWKASKQDLDDRLADTDGFGAKPFSVLFQVDRLAKNAALPPDRVEQLLPKISRVYRTSGAETTAAALVSFYREVPLAGPATQARQLSRLAFEKLLDDCVASYDRYAPDNPFELTKRHAHINPIHKTIVTPTGTYLEGPVPEPTNRVLRENPERTDHFFRVVFEDENGTPVGHDSHAHLGNIYHGRFKGVMDGALSIAGRAFSFLGFSHSSLRSQSCWFMAPMFDTEHGTLRLAPHVIKEMGDFTTIRTPAKCAARIGQCFTDTAASVLVRTGEWGTLEPVERNGRDFSDGVGTISRELLEEVWRTYGAKAALKPTLLQIRFKGCKGMVSLDTRLQGRRLMTRASMEKFEGSQSTMLEICGAALRPLPMFLNRSLIKILEDLGVGKDTFMQIQRQEVDNLRNMLTSPINTATFLEMQHMTKATKLPLLINDLSDVGLDYHVDSFLRVVVELAIVSRMRDIKYKGRIHIDQGVTLYGIMDETGYLNEGEVYVAIETSPEGGRHEVIGKDIVITRSPAMHPGDVRLVNAVSVPSGSPLKRLTNMIVFSQHGERDLPSMLSGGDLDGDLYNLIWDARLKPNSTEPPADYDKVKPVELDCEVTAKDMSDFFVTFMETDVLGMLSTRHMQFADQLPDGTRSKECITLAQLASIAVDYSKTGIPVDMDKCPKLDPRRRNCRPDFLAPSPRVIFTQKGYLDMDDDENEDDDENFEGLDTERRPFRYYRSEKALGHLYRAIDECQFLSTMPGQSRALDQSVASVSANLPSLLEYALEFGRRRGVIYEHEKELARDIRASYDQSVIDIMYSCCPTLHTHLAEEEVFAGIILGCQGGTKGKNLRELSEAMRERYEAVVKYAVMRVEEGDAAVQAVADGQTRALMNEAERLPRAIACLFVAVDERGLEDRMAGELKSFGYIAAATCLREIRRWVITMTFGRSSMLPTV